MTLLNPGALRWAVLFVPIVAMYLVRVQLRRTAVSTNLFWNEVLQQSQTRASLRNLSHWLSLLMQLLIAGLLILALAEPLIAERRAPRDLVLIIDLSASMSAVHNGVTRLQLATDRAAGLVESMIPGDRTAILLAAAEPRVLCGMTGDKEQLRSALSAPAAIGRTTTKQTIDRAIELAEQLRAASRAAEPVSESRLSSVEIISDLCFPGAITESPVTDVGWTVVGVASDNAGIARFEARRDPQDAAEYELLIEVANQSDRELHGRLDLDLDDRPLDARTIDLAANQRWSDVITLRIPPSGGLLAARLMSADSMSEVYVDALSSDNVRQLQLPALRRLPVTLVTDGNVFLERVLEASQLVDLRIVPVGNGLPDVPESSKNGLLILDSFTPVEMPEGNVLVIAPSGPCDLWATGEPLVQPVVMVQDESSVLLKDVRLSEIQIPTAAAILPVADHRVLVASQTNAPLMAEFPRASGDVVVVAAGLREGDFPLRTAFPIFMANLVNRYSGTEAPMNPDPAVSDPSDVCATDGDLRPQVNPNRFPTSASLNSQSASAWKFLLVAALALALGEWFLFHRRVPG